MNAITQNPRFRRAQRAPFLLLTGILLAVALSAAVALGAPAPATDVGGTIDADTTWDLAGSPYVITSDLTVAAGVTLTIDPGVLVQANGKYLLVEGTLLAVGSAAQPITFTSLADSGPGQWGGILFDGGGGTLAHVTLRHGGGLSTFDYGRSVLWVQNSPGVTLSNAQVYGNDDVGGGGPVTAVRVVDSPLTVSATAFYDNLAQPLDDSALRVDGSGSVVTVQGAHFYDNVGDGIYAGGTVTVTNTIFENNSAAGLRTTAANWSRAAALSFSGDEGTITGGAFGASTRFAADWEADYFNVDGVITVPAASSVLVEPGNEFRASSSAQFIIAGEFYALGTPAQPITFTSKTNSGPNQWDGLVFDGGGGALEYVTLRYGGNLGSFDYGRSVLWVEDSAGVTLANAWVVANDGGAGGPSTAVRVVNSLFSTSNTEFSANVSALEDSALRIEGDSVVTVDDTLFADNAGRGIDASATVTVTNSSFSNNGGSAIRIAGGAAAITCGSFLNNLEGIRLQGTVDDFFVGGSAFSGNNDFGINNQTGSVVDATYNYWGDPSGPSGNGPGSGDAVSTFVAYNPWLDSAACTVQLSGLQAANDGPTIASLPTALSATVATGSDVAYSWDFGDGAAGSGAAVTHVYPAAGVYSATVVAANSIGTLTATTVVEVTPRPSFGGSAWHDADGDGARGQGEAVLSGVQVTAAGPAGTLPDTTGADGRYDIDIIGAGWYTLTATLDGYVPTTPNPLSLPLPDNGSGNVDFGFAAAVPPTEGQLTGRVFIDHNGNGLAEPAEEGVSIAVSLYRDDVPQATTTSDSSGLFSFTGLAAGVFAVRAQAAMGLFPAELRADALVVAVGETTFVNLGFSFGGTVGGSVSDVEGNGVANVLLQLEQPAGSVVYTEVSDDDGSYQFLIVPPGDYTLRLVPPAGFTPADGESARAISLPSDGSVVENWLLDTPGSVTIRVRSWLSPSYIPIGGVDVNVTGPDNFAATYTTGFDGRIILNGLTPGLYAVAPLTPTLPLDATVSPGQRSVNVSANSGATANFTVNLARAITVYCQRNTATSAPYGPSFPCRTEVRVVADDLGTPAGTLVGAADLAGGGVTLFGDLPAGTYEVAILPDDTVAGQESWPDHSETVTVGAATYAVVRYPHNPSYATATIWGYAFWDKNLDGQRQHHTGGSQSWDEDHQSSSNGLTVELRDGNGALLATTVTQRHPQYQDGWFAFPTLAAGSYQVHIVYPVGFGNTTPTTLFRDVDLLSYVAAAEFGYRRYLGADARGRVYFDNDADGHFNLDIDDPLAGITVTLQAPDSTPLAALQTPATGMFAFTNQLSGEYLVAVADIFGGQQPTTLVQPAALPSGSANVWVDFPLVPTDGQGRVLLFVDDDLDGTPGPAEQRVGGVRILRYGSDCRQTIGVVPQFAITDGGGLATFGTVSSGFGCARVDLGDEDLPPGVLPAAPLGVAVPGGSSAPVWLPLVPPSTLTVLPFWDVDGNLARDPDEPPVAGALVTVAGEEPVTSSHLGAAFPLAEGAYGVTVAPPAGMSLGVSQPLAAVVDSSSSALLPVPLRYSGVIAGQVVTSGGAAGFAGLTVELHVPTTGATLTTQVAATTNGFLFTNVPPATYQLRLPDVPPGYRIDGVPIIPYASGSAIVQNLTLVPLGDVSGTMYLDSNGNGQRGSGEPGTNSYALFLLDNSGSGPQEISVAADGTFVIPDLQSHLLYALTTDLDYPGYGPPGAAVTEAPGWFAVDNQNLAVDVGIFPWSGNDEFNVVLGQVYIQNGSVRQPVAGAEVGYFAWDDSTGCQASAPPLLGMTISDVNGEYRLDTAFVQETAYYCLRVVDLPGYTQQGVLAVPGNMTYQTAGGPVIQPRIDAGKDLRVASVGTRAGSGATVRFAAFHDANLNGIWDPFEQPLAGATLHGVATALDGSGAVSGLADGRHELASTPPAGYAPLGEPLRVVYLDGAGVALFPLPFRLADVFVGAAFVDYDGDGQQAVDGQERGVAGVSVTLSGPVVTTTISGADGLLRLPALPDGTYDLTVETGPGYRPVADNVVTVAGGGVVTIPLAPLGQVSGVVYEDWDGDGRRLPDEPLVAVPVTMTLSSGEASRLFGGQLLFMNVADGDYTLTPGWPAAAAVAITLDGATAAAVALPAVDPGFVRGTVWVDGNCDGQRQPAEAALAGVEVMLDGLMVTTDAWGRFLLAGVPAGSHALGVTLPNGLQAASPVATTTGARGAAVGIAAQEAGCGYSLYLPLATVR